MNNSVEISVGWVRMLLVLSSRVLRVELSVLWKMALLPFLDFWLMSLPNREIAFLVQVRECLVIRVRACF